MLSTCNIDRLERVAVLTWLVEIEMGLEIANTGTGPSLDQALDQTLEG